MIHSSHAARFEFSSPCEKMLGKHRRRYNIRNSSIRRCFLQWVAEPLSESREDSVVLPPPPPRSSRNLDLKLQTRQIEIDYARVGPRLFIRKMRLTGKTRVGHVSTGSIPIQVDSSRVQWIPAHRMRRRYLQHARCTRIMTADADNHLFRINFGRHARTSGIGIR